MIERFYRFITGFLMVQVRGKNVSRFLNLCIRNGIHIYQMDNMENMQCTFGMNLRDLYRLTPLLRKTRVRIFIKKRMGLPFFLYRYRKRKIFAASLLGMALGILFLSTRIWRIEVVGNSSVGRDTILNYLKEKEINYGVDRNSIDNDALELSLRQDFDPVIWASVYEEGTKLVVCIQEKLVSEKKVKQTDTCMDLVATKDAKIASVITRNGISLVKAGDKVKAGDILVSGRQEILDDNGEIKEYYYQSADADILAYAVYDYEDSIPKQMVVSNATGKEHTRFFFRIFDYQFTTPKLHADFEHSETFEESSQLCLLNSFYLPVYIGKSRQVELEKRIQKVSMEEAKSIARENFNQFLADLEENGVEIMGKNVMIKSMNDNYHIYGKVKVCESIIKQKPTEILKTPDKTETAQEEE